MLVVRVQTRARAAISASLQATARPVARGTHALRRQHMRLIVLYRLLWTGHADAAGRRTLWLRVRYTGKTRARAVLTITATQARHSMRRTLTVTLLPPRSR